MTQEALKLALEALEVVKPHYTQNRHVTEAITAIKEALAQEQEPVCPDCKAKVLYECVACSSNNYPLKTEQEPVAWEQFYPDIGKPQIEQPKVRTGDCLLVGVCASEGHKIQAKQEQEPVATDWERIARVQNAKLMAMCDEAGGFEKLCEVMDKYEQTTPPQRTFVGLTNEEIDSYFEDQGWSPSKDYYPVIKAIEAKLKQKNGYAEEKNT